MKGVSLKWFCKADKNNKKFAKSTDLELPLINGLTAVALITNT